MSLPGRAYAWVKTGDAPVARWIRAARDALLGEMPVLAAGTALFAILATVPTLAAIVGVYAWSQIRTTSTATCAGWRACCRSRSSWAGS
jgi:hypothetical protein